MFGLATLTMHNIFRNIDCELYHSSFSSVTDVVCATRSFDVNDVCVQ